MRAYHSRKQLLTASLCGNALGHMDCNLGRWRGRPRHSTGADAPAGMVFPSTSWVVHRNCTWLAGYHASTASSVLSVNGVLQVLAQHTLRGDAMMTVRRPGECNYFADPGCELVRPNKQFTEKQLQVRNPVDP